MSAVAALTIRLSAVSTLTIRHRGYKLRQSSPGVIIVDAPTGLSSIVLGKLVDERDALDEIIRAIGSRRSA